MRHWLTGAVPTHHQSAVATLAAIWVFGPGNYREGSVGFSVSYSDIFVVTFIAQNGEWFRVS